MNSILRPEKIGIPRMAFDFRFSLEYKTPLDLTLGSCLATWLISLAGAKVSLANFWLQVEFWNSPTATSPIVRLREMGLATCANYAVVMH